MRTPNEVSDIILRFRQEYVDTHHPGSEVLRVLTNLEQCRTSVLGGHVDACPACGIIKVSYNSCRNRHCPKCQGFEREKWITARKEELLPVKYFHLVFTLPDVLNPIGLKHSRKVYNTLFRTAWYTVNEFSQRQGIQAGMIALLHTWGGELQYHPHMHCLVAAGGIDETGKWKNFPNANNEKPYLFPVKGMSKMFRAKFTELLNKEVCIDPEIRKGMFANPWVVFAQNPFAAGNKVVDYIGRYSYRVAIANSRITNIDESSVSFTCKDRKKKDNTKTVTITGIEFLRRFSMHVLPNHFVKIRHYGYLAPTNRKKLRDLQLSFQLNTVPLRRKKLTWKAFCIQQTGHGDKWCPFCNSADMVTIETFQNKNASSIPRPPPLLIHT